MAEIISLLLKNNNKLNRSSGKKALVTSFPGFLMFFLNIRDEFSQVMER